MNIPYNTRLLSGIFVRSLRQHPVHKSLHPKLQSIGYRDNQEPGGKVNELESEFGVIWPALLLRRPGGHKKRNYLSR